MDRSLGKKLAEVLREHGHTVHTLDSVYGEPAAPKIADLTWIAEAGQHGWVVLAKDKNIAHSKVEQNAMAAASAKVFCLTTGTLPGAQQIARILKHLPRIIELSRQPGPYAYGIYKSGVFLLWRPGRSVGAR